MIDLSPTRRKTDPAITIEAKRDDYGIHLSVRHRRNRRKLTPEQYAVILRAGAHQLRTWAEQMDDEAGQILEA